MVYIMKIYVDGGCRRNGSSKAIAAASAVRTSCWGRKYHHRTEQLSTGRRATNQRAEITAIILGLQMALDAFENLYSNPKLKVTIFSDSRYAVDCMNEWIYKWSSNGWVNSRGDEVANRDLIEEASDLDDQLKELGRVRYRWIPRSENELADKHCNVELDAMERAW